MGPTDSSIRCCSNDEGVELQHCADDVAPGPWFQASRAHTARSSKSVTVHFPSQARVHPSSSSELQPSSSRTDLRHVWLRCGLVVLASICALWTVWLIFLTVAPNTTINWVMRTETIDEGSFWHLADTPPPLLWPTVFGLGVIVLGHLATIVQIFPRSTTGNGCRLVRSVGLLAGVRERIKRTVVNAATDTTRSRIASGAAKLAVFLVASDSPRRKLLNMAAKICDLAVEVILLARALETGPPLLLFGIFTAIIVTNALSCVWLLFVPSKRTGLSEILLDVLFDFLIAVGYPIIVLIHCFSSFKFDRDKLAINLEVFPPGWFERFASVVANPVQTDIILKTLRLLRVESVADFVFRVGVNLIFCVRLYRVATRVQHSNSLHSSMYPKNHRIAAVSVMILVFTVIVFVEESIRTSNLACSSHPECVVKAHRWTLVQDNVLTQCPCLTLIEVDIAPKTYGAWIHPRDVSSKVAQLAATGDLQTIQLINRYLPALPEELRRCTKMTHLSLVYTHTSTFPTWVSEFTELQYLHVEGTEISSLVSLPDGMFDRMSSLTFLHLGIHPPIKKLPSFGGLASLKSLTLALFFSLAELPSFDSLRNVEHVTLIALVSIDSLPDLTNLKKLRAFEVTDRATWCCNGFLGECDLQSPHCKVHPLWRTPAASCLPANRTDDRPTQGTLNVLKQFSSSVCGELILPDNAENLPTQAGMDECDGALYRQCGLSKHKEAMCYNARFMGISCTENPLPIKMRRLQIQRRVGDPCDPMTEAWLGCSN